MRFAVIGSGAVGSYYGGRLVLAGEDVHFLFRSDFDAVSRNGLTVRSCEGDFHIKVNAYHSAKDMPKADVILVALKGTQSALLAELLPPLLHDESVVICLQNGLGNEEHIAAIVPPERVIAGSAFICSEKIEPGVIEHTAAGALKIGWFLPHPNPLPTVLAQKFERAGVRCGVDEIGRRIKWSKLVWNIPFNGLSVFYGGITADVIMNDHYDFALQLMKEVIIAAGEDGIALDSALIDSNMKATLKMGPYRTSMMVDLEKKRPLEIETIIGEPYRRGISHGKNLPAMKKLYDTLKLIA